MQPNSLTFIALCNEFCSALEQVATGGAPALEERPDFVAAMLNYIPRLYISATDLKALPSPSPFATDGDDTESYPDTDGELHDNGSDLFMMTDESEWAIQEVLDEDYYESIRRAVEGVMGEEDVYLEVFEEDMKYSDTPVSASIAEGLADIFQSLYNFVETVRDAPSERLSSILRAAKEDFEHYWSRIACNLMRALNNIRYNTSADND